MENGSKTGVYEFDRFRLDAGKLMLYRDRVEISMPPKMVKTLAVLVASPGTILSKDELIERIWSDTIVDESNLSQHLYHLRKVLGERPDGKPYIETLRRRGYRFNGEVNYVSRSENRAPSIRDTPMLSASSTVEREGNVLRFVDWQSAPERMLRVSPVESLISEEALVQRRGAKASWLMVGLALVAAIGAAAAFFQYRSSADTVVPARKEISVLRLTSGIKPLEATVSPNGDYFVYHEVGDEGEHLWLHQVGQSSRVEIGRQSEYFYRAKTFSPDGTFIFYVAGKETGETSLYRVPTIGGPPAKILDNLSGAISFSPDGRQMVFIREDRQKGKWQIITADSGNENENIILERSADAAFVGSPAWSPDGKSIVFASVDPDKTIGIYETTSSGEEPRRLSDQKWANVYRIVWTHDGRGLALIATRAGEGYSTSRNQVYYISYPEGKSLRLTTDGSWHQEWSLGVSRDDAIVVVPFNRSSQIWSMDSTGDSKSAIQITQGLADGRAGLAPVRDGRVGFVSRVGEQVNLWLMNADGSGLKQLPTGVLTIAEELRTDPKGRYFVFSGYKDGNSRLYRCDVDGGNVTQLTFDDSQPVDSTVSTDGNSVVYHSDTSRGVPHPPELYRISIDGGEPERFGEVECVSPNYSPDGRLLSCIGSEKIVILSAIDGSLIRTYAIPHYSKVNFGVRWMPGGDGVVYIRNQKGVSNLWIQPLGGGSPKPLTDFTSSDIYNYAFSFDGTRLFIARGQQIADATLIRHYR